MTTVIAQSAGVLHTSAWTLRNLFGAIAPHLAVDDEDDPEVPAFTRLHVEIRDGELRLYGTDRYTFAVVRHPLTTTTAEYRTQFSIDGDDIRRLGDTLPQYGQVTLLIDDHRLYISGADFVHNIPGSPQYPLSADWRALFGRHLHPADQPTGRIVINPVYLARLEAAQDLQQGTPMMMHLRGPHKAVIVTFGDTFIALIMPIRVNSPKNGEGETHPLDPWFDLLDEDN
ncbi:hypothetical protein [Nonomuraea basaltis]|uniref:hypothetical protein n=1 Tax=Nonomuraea basaltis TaxID=2495887 RepID=UPI00110C668A|nr:hypothetical protein [Nonomuraea basaltis]TMR91274.1 hypothetical protein EJK15_50680 [Nonomuraea basaltis]